MSTTKDTAAKDTKDTTSAETKDSNAAAGSKPFATAQNTVHDGRTIDRPMTGILTQDDGKRTEHGAHPLDPMYQGTVIGSGNAATAQAAAARKEVGLEDSDPNLAERQKDAAFQDGNAVPASVPTAPVGDKAPAA